ncbi:hypothetical protein BLNAU_22870 [Blattamonas nauphoetae]|uniref:DUF4371 domain-containing protein n=1 Tax=Blattamonas nauphoetae TaxID=2049346 RepID=A0ABQ9WW14_9EUKA|nr:hypothetical protein BLNAU_22870 [Blattamonas nauphoetae]
MDLRVAKIGSAPILNRDFVVIDSSQLEQSKNIQSYLSVLVFRVLVERRKVVSKWEGNRKWKSMDGQRQPQSLANIPQKVRFALYIHFKDRYADILSFDKTSAISRHATSGTSQLSSDFISGDIAFLSFGSSGSGSVGSSGETYSDFGMWNVIVSFIRTNGDSDSGSRTIDLIVYVVLCVSSFPSPIRPAKNISWSDFMRHCMSVQHRTSFSDSELVCSDTDQEMVACPEEFKNVIYQNRIAAASYIASSILPATRFPSLCQLLDSRTNVPQIFSSALTSPRVYWHVVDKCFLLDGTTDSTGTKQIACHLRVLNDNNQPFSMLLSIRPLLKEADGRAHFDLVNSLFDEFDLPANSLVGIGTDGESTMTGLGNGLWGRLLNQWSYIIPLHCSSHRLQLVLIHTLSVAPLSVIQRLLTSYHSFAVHINRSQSRKQHLGEIQAQNGGDKQLIPYSVATRWFTLYITASTVLKHFQSLFDLTRLATDPQTRQFAHCFGPASYLRLFLTVLIFKPGYLLCKALQSADLNFVSVDSLLQHTRESIHSHIDPYLLISDAIDSLSSQKYLPPLHKEDSWINVSDMWIRANTLSQPRKSFRKAKHFTPPLRHHRPRTTDATLSRRPINPLLSQLLYKPRPKPNYSFEFFLCYHGRHVMLKGRSATYGDKRMI